MRKFVSVGFMVLVLLSALVLPAYAAEGEAQEEPQVNTEIIEETPVETEGTSSESTEPSDGGSESSVNSLDGATVNVSESSIMAIADAVVMSEVPTISNKNGYAVPLYSTIPDVWDDYEYHVIGKGGNGYWFYIFGDNVMTVTSTGGYNYSSFGRSWNGSKFVDIKDSVTSGWGGLTFYYTDFDLKDYNGNLLWASDVPVFYEISFNTGFEDLVLDSVSSSEFVLPEISYDGYRFDGWYFDEEYSLPYTAGFDFTADTTLYAKWTPYRTISFVTGIEDYELDSVTVLSGDTYTVPSFTYAGYDFIGAYTDDIFENQFVDGTVINDDLTLYLRFEPIVYDYGALLTDTNNTLGVVQSQLWIVLVVGLLYFVYRLFRIFF